MIRRLRHYQPVPDDLTSPGGIGQKELGEVMLWLEGNRQGRRPTFRAYKAASVGRTLERLFHGKCAYCESPYTRTQPVDVEHWRPKAEVEIPGQKEPLPGYEWLAASWENLLPSCADCNRRRRQIVVRPQPAPGPNARPVFDPVEIVLGKGNFFPLVDESTRVRSPATPLTQEQPLLVNPCTEDPARMFWFRDNGAMVPHPKIEGEPALRARALASIEIYALNRKGLVDERHERILILRARFALVTALLKLEARLQPNAAATPLGAEVHSAVLELIDREIRQLVRLTEPSQPYALLMRQYVSEYLRSIRQP